jgi:hypothetical protein
MAPFWGVFGVLASVGTEPAPVMPNPNFIVLKDQLDEVWDNDFYCADVAGTDVHAGNILQMHTCKEPVNDELFETNTPVSGNIYVVERVLCVTAAKLAAGSQLIVDTCVAGDSAQHWMSTSDGQIQLASDSTLCWTASGELAGTGAGAEGDHLSRTLTLELCAGSDAKYHSWLLPGGYVGRAGP